MVLRLITFCVCVAIVYMLFMAGLHTVAEIQRVQSHIDPYIKELKK